MELAVVLPLLAFIFLISVDYARIFYYSQTIDNCARNGAVYGSQASNSQFWKGNNNQQVWQDNGSQIASIQQAAVADGRSLQPPLSASNVTVANATDADGNAVVQVTVNYTFNTITNFPGIPSQVNMVRTAQMRVAVAYPQ